MSADATDDRAALVGRVNALTAAVSRLSTDLIRAGVDPVRVEERAKERDCDR